MTTPTDESRNSGEATAAFERDLEALILQAFARGVPIERTWTVTIPVSDAPDWTLSARPLAIPDRQGSLTRNLILVALRG